MMKITRKEFSNIYKTFCGYENSGFFHIEYKNRLVTHLSFESRRTTETKPTDLDKQRNEMDHLASILRFCGLLDEGDWDKETGEVNDNVDEEIKSIREIRK